MPSEAASDIPAHDTTAAETSTIDALAQDANRPQLPADAPGLWPYLRLPFRVRADFFRTFALFEEMQRKLEAKTRTARKAKQFVTADAAEMFDLYALMDDLMSMAAVDKNAYQTWVAEHSDEEFLALFSAYVQRSQPGEA